MSEAALAGAAFWARPGLRALLEALDAAGEEARVVGGAVRNTLLGLPVTDVDVATTALPAEVAARVAAAGMRAVPTGIDHGTVTVVVDHHAYEVTTLREDTETDGRRAVVRFGRSWDHDAQRRDFTLNALYATRAGQVVDLVGGLADLAARRVRFIGDAEARIREDYLRILRLFRFHAAYGAGPLDPVALRAAVRLRAGLATLSRERVRAELLKLLLAPGAADTLAAMSDSGLLQPLVAGIGDVTAFSRLADLERHWSVAPAAVRRLGALALRVRDDAERLRAKLRLSNAETRRLEAMARLLERREDAALAAGMPAVDARAARALIYRRGGEAVRDWALLAAAKRGGDISALEEVVAMAGAWRPPKFPVSAADILARGERPGPRLGAVLARAEAAWVAADFPEDAARLAPIISGALADAGTARHELAGRRASGEPEAD